MEPEHARRWVAYGNARKILPLELLRAVQRHFEGGLLWIPARSRQRLKTAQHPDRNRTIHRSHRRGVSIARIAERFGLSLKRIRQILREKPEMT